MYRESMGHKEVEARDLSTVRICFITLGIYSPGELTDFFDSAELITSLGQPKTAR